MKVQDKILALDVGKNGIGVAVSDSAGWAAQPVETIRRTQLNQDLDSILSLLEKHDAKKILVGFPVNMNGSEGPASKAMRQFGEQLGARLPDGVKIIYWDERLTTWEAKKRMLQADVSRARRKQNRDVMAAVVLLEDYLHTTGEKT